MTQVQKIIAGCLGKNLVTPGDRVYITDSKCTDAISHGDKFCGAYGRIFACNQPFNVPKGIFIDLRGVLRNDATSLDVAQYIYTTLKNEISCDISLEFGGDSMTFLNMDDRFEITKTLTDCANPPFAVIFEYDYVTVEYTMEKFGKKPAVFFNDGPESYIKVFPLDLSAV